MLKASTHTTKIAAIALALLIIACPVIASQSAPAAKLQANNSIQSIDLSLSSSSIKAQPDAVVSGTVLTITNSDANATTLNLISTGPTPIMFYDAGLNVTSVVLDGFSSRPIMLDVLSPANAGTYIFFITAAGGTISESVQLNVEVALPQITITPAAFPEKIVAGGNVDIIMTVTNTADFDVTNISYALLIDDEFAYGTVVSHIAPNSSKDVKYTWTAVKGNITYEVSITTGRTLIGRHIGYIDVKSQPDNGGSSLALIATLAGVLPIIMILVIYFLLLRNRPKKKDRSPVHGPITKSPQEIAVFEQTDTESAVPYMVKDDTPPEKDKPAKKPLVCPKCKKKLEISSSKRPLKITCPWCEKKVEIK